MKYPVAAYCAGFVGFVAAFVVIGVAEGLYIQNQTVEGVLGNAFLPDQPDKQLRAELHIVIQYITNHPIYVVVLVAGSIIGGIIGFFGYIEEQKSKGKK